MRRQLTLGVLLITLGLGLGVGVAHTPIVKKYLSEGPSLRGHLQVVQLRPFVDGGCDQVLQRQAAVQQLYALEAAKRSVTRWLQPVSNAAPSPSWITCQGLAYRTRGNLIVNAGENFLVDAFQNTVELEILKYHGLGTGTVDPAEGDTGCGTELTTQYNPDSTRATGSLTEGASTNIFRTVGTNAVDATVAVTEWCLMSQAATGGGTMWSRVEFAVINLVSGDSLQTTYDLTVE